MVAPKFSYLRHGLLSGAPIPIECHQEKTPSPNLIFEHSGPALEWNGFRMFDLLFTNVPQPCCKFIDFGANVLR